MVAPNAKKKFRIADVTGQLSGGREVARFDRPGYEVEEAV